MDKAQLCLKLLWLGIDISYSILFCHARNEQV